LFYGEFFMRFNAIPYHSIFYVIFVYDFRYVLRNPHNAIGENHTL
jgi:hypothetical protein